MAGKKGEIVQIEVAEGTLTIKSIKDKDKGATDEYTLYKGISQRNFTRKFTLADGDSYEGEWKEDSYHGTGKLFRNS